jgi:hypothetical protein
MARAMRASGGLEAEGDADDEADLGVDRFDAAVGQAVFDRGEDRGLVFDDAALQVDEGGDAAAAGPADPGLEGIDGFLVVELEGQPESFLEQVGPVQRGVGLGDPGQLGLLPAGEVLGVFHNASGRAFTTVNTVEEVPELATARLTQLTQSHAKSYTTPRGATPVDPLAATARQSP